MAGIDARALYGYSDANVKVLPSNQTLILAGEAAGRRMGGDTLLEQASRLVAGSTDLKRVTIMSARPDSTVVVQADYFSAQHDYPRDEVFSGDGIQTPGSQSVVTSDLRTTTEPSTTSYTLKPTQLYAQTQRGYEDTKTSVLDVLA